MKAYKLIPRSSYRTELRSDTLWGLIIVALRYLYSNEEVTQIVESFLDGDPEFIITSSFPYRNENSSTEYYFPKPILNANWPGDLDAKGRDAQKDFKKLKYLIKSDFEAIINGELTEHEFFTNWINNRGESYKKKFDVEEQILKNSINRLTGGTEFDEDGGQLYYSNEKFIPDGGRFFLADGKLDYIDQALRFLEHSGFGGDSSTGKGSFKVEVNEFNLKEPNDGTSQLSLSLFSPKKETIETIRSNGNSTWYNLEKRSGKFSTRFSNPGEYQKKSVVCFSEGSVFPHLPAKSGRIIAVSDSLSDHTAYHFGIPFFVKANFKDFYAL